MLKLSKYELRKSRNVLLGLIGVLAVLELYFLYGVNTNEEHIFIAAGLLTVFSFICFGAVFLLAVLNYYREINSKTSYLVFMTAVSPEKIILSKMLTVLLFGILLATGIGTVAVVDVNILLSKYDQYQDIVDVVRQALQSFGVNTGEIITNILMITFQTLLSFFSTVSVVYFCITLAATLLQNSKLKAVISVVFLILVSFLERKANNWISKNVEVIYATKLSVWALIRQSWPYILLDAGIMLICIFLCSWMIRKKLSL